MSKIRVIARGSSLSRVQVEEVFRRFPELSYSAQWLDTFGDRRKDISLLDGAAPDDIFTRELDNAIINGDADIAIHSAKDLPFPLDSRLEVIALFGGADMSDSLVSRNNLTLSMLPAGSIVATSSQQRKTELLKIRPDLSVKGIRGTIEERIRQVHDGAYDALIVATCALQRLGLEQYIIERLPFETNPLQGYLAITARKGSDELKSLFDRENLLLKQGSVTIVGGGPGNPELLTVAAVKALQNAEIILFDNLIDRENLEQYVAEKVYVGKRNGRHSAEQSDINRLLLNASRSGKRTVRLKGGDPAIFAHTGEEVEYLRRNFVNVSIIPGITAASACAASAGIALTHRHLSSSIAFINGHSKTPITSPDETLAYYMGASNLPRIAAQLITEGRPANTPVLLGYNISLPDEKHFDTTLGLLVTEDTKYPTPLIVIVGEVAGTHIGAASSIKRTLYTGLTCPNADYIHTPLIEICPPAKGSDEQRQLAEATARIEQYDYLLFTSRHAVNAFFDVFDNSNSLKNIRIVSIGATTSQAIRCRGINIVEQVEHDDSYGVIDYFRSQNNGGKRVLFPRSNLALPLIPNGLRELGYTVDAVVAYRTVLPRNPRKVNLSNIRRIVFTSPSTIDNFITVYGSLPSDKEFITRGRTTEEYLNNLLNRPN